MTKHKKSVGRPCSYSTKMTERVWQVVDLGGANVAQLCAMLGIGSFSTFYQYRDKFPEFKEATDMCAMTSCATLETALMEGATGAKKIDSKAAMWMLYNKDREQYKMAGIANSSDNSVNIKIGNINMASLNKMSDIELDRMLQSTALSIKAIEVTQLPELSNSTVIEAVDDDNE